MGMTSQSSRFAGVNQREERWLRRLGTGLTYSRSPIYKPPKLPKRVTSFTRTNTDTTKMAQNLLELLESTCRHHAGKKILVYQPGSFERGAVGLSYSTLLNTANERATDMIPFLNLEENPVVLLHISDHLHGITWFWTIMAAGGIPCISTPFTKDGTQRRKHLSSLLKLLANPLIITTEELVSEFAGWNNLRLKTIEELRTTPSSYLNSKGPALTGHQKGSDDVAVLMLTSGSTGNAKAVGLTHKQLLHAVVGKSQHHQTTEDDVFLNWTGLDHVANLTEIHLHALRLGATQVHLPGSMILAEPMIFLDKVSVHKVTYTFAPNFFLASLVQRILEAPSREKENERMASIFEIPAKILEGGDARVQIPRQAVVNLSSLRALISGGESNIVQTCSTLTDLLQHFGAPKSFIRPGFGMTETCAGSIYNAADCPAYDLVRGAEFACLGECIPGISFRLCRQDGSIAVDDEVGELQVTGEVVFKAYHNDACSTTKSFTQDGWFRTGDMGYKDAKGRLHLTGRDTDTVIINGVNHYPQAIETAVEVAKIPGVTPSYVVCFAHRPAGSPTESVVVVYLPSYTFTDSTARVNTAASISKAVITHCGARPYKILPLDEFSLQKSSLGKLPRSKIRKAFEDGVYDKLIINDQELIKCFQDTNFEPPVTRTEFAIVAACNSLLKPTGIPFGINNDIFKIGISSIGLLKLRIHLQEGLNVAEMPISMFFANPVIRDLAVAIDDIQMQTYNPIVILQPNGTKTPLFLFHPGTGEILIFMNLARQFPERPIYAIRARGFDGEPFFSTLEEMVTTYHAAIKKVQPTGPYALLGYSFGSFCAFECTKIMEAAGDEVKLLAILDQAPYQKERARRYDWYETCMTISFFLGLTEEEFTYKVLDGYRLLTHKQVLDSIFAIAPKSRIDELGMSQAKLDNWTKLALNSKRLVYDWEPSGVVSRMDVFYTGPLVGRVQANTVDEWFKGFISKWRPFARDGSVGWYEVGGTHRSMISPPHLGGFLQPFKKVMEERGL